MPTKDQSIDYTSRNKPEVFKPLIDAELLKLAKYNGADIGKTEKILATVDPKKMGAWGYLTSAIDATRSMVYEGKVAENLGFSWSHQLFEQDMERFPFFAGETENDVPEDLDFSENPIVLEYYPKESHEALRQDMFVGGADADVIGLWRVEDRTRVFHAHMEGFEILGEDPVDYLQRIVRDELGIK